MAIELLIKFPADGSAVDYGALVRDDYTTDENLFDPKSFKYTRDRRTFNLLWDTTLVNRLSAANPSDLIDASVKVDGVLVFTGLVTPLETVTRSDKDAPFALELVDYSVLLDRPLGSGVEILAGWLYNPALPAASLVTQLAARAARAITLPASGPVGTYGTAYGPSNCWISYIALTPEDNALEALRNACFENGYTFRFGADGGLILVPITSSGSPVWTFSDSAQNIEDGSFSQRRETISEDSVKVSYRKLTYLTLGLTDKNRALINGAEVVALFEASQFADVSSLSVGQTLHCKITLGKTSDDGVKVLTFEPQVINILVSASYYHIGIYEYFSLDERFVIDPVTRDVTVSRVGGVGSGYNSRTVNPTVSNWLQNGNEIDFDLDWGTLSRQDSIQRYVRAAGCKYLGKVLGDADTAVFDGSRKEYLSYTMSLGATPGQASNVAALVKSLAIDNCLVHTLKSPDNVALGSLVSLGYASKGVSVNGLIVRRTYGRAARVWGYTVKQISPVTYTNPPSTGPVLSPQRPALAPILEVIDPASGQLKKPIIANALPAILPEVGLAAGLYFGSDALGFFDGSAWKTRIQSNGNAYFDGEISAGGAVKSSNFVTGAGGAGFRLSADGTLEATNGIFRGQVVATSGSVGGLAVSANSLLYTNAGKTIALDVGGVNPALAIGTTGTPEFKVTLAGVLTAISGTVGGWTLGASSLVSGSGGNTVGLDSGGTNPAIYAGSATPSAAPFRVTPAGVLTATSGTVGGWTLGASTLTAAGGVSLTAGAANVANIAVGTGSNIAGLGSPAAGTDIAVWAGSTFANRATAPFRVTAAGALYTSSATIAAGATIGTWIVGASFLDSQASGVARIRLDKTNNRVSVMNSSNNETVAMGYLNSLPKNGSPWSSTKSYAIGDYVSLSGITYKCILTNTGITPPNATYWAVSTDTWTASDYGFWAKQGQLLSIDGDVSYTNGDWLIGKDSSYLIKQGSTVVTRLGMIAGNNGLFINEGNTGANYRSRMTNSEFFVGNDSAYLQFTAGALYLLLTSFKVSTSLTSVLGSLEISSTGTISALTNQLTLSADATSGWFKHATAIQAKIGSSVITTVDNTGLSVGALGSAGRARVFANGFDGQYGATFTVSTNNNLNGAIASLAFHSTFVTPTTDKGPRRSADIWSGFYGANWGGEYLAFGVGGATDTGLRTTQVAYFNSAGAFSIRGNDAENTSFPTHDTAGYGTLGITRNASATYNRPYFAMTRAGNIAWQMGIGVANELFLSATVAGDRVLTSQYKLWIDSSSNLNLINHLYAVSLYASGIIYANGNIINFSGGASIGCTPNLHLDPATSASTYLNWTRGESVVIGNGAGGGSGTWFNKDGSGYVGANLTAGGNLYSSNGLIYATKNDGSEAQIHVQSYQNRDTYIYTNSSSCGLYESTFGNLISRGYSSNEIQLGVTGSGVYVPSTTASTSTTTGAFHVVGGVGIGGSLYVGGNVSAPNVGTKLNASNGGNISTNTSLPQIGVGECGIVTYNPTAVVSVITPATGTFNVSTIIMGQSCITYSNRAASSVVANLATYPATIIYFRIS